MEPPPEYITEPDEPELEDLMTPEQLRQFKLLLKAAIEAGNYLVSLQINQTRHYCNRVTRITAVPLLYADDEKVNKLIVG